MTTIGQVMQNFLQSFQFGNLGIDIIIIIASMILGVGFETNNVFEKLYIISFGMAILFLLGIGTVNLPIIGLGLLLVAGFLDNES